MTLVDELSDLVDDVRDEAGRAAEHAADLAARALDRYSLDAIRGLRRHRPIIAGRSVAIVTRADDVREVLADHEAFTVALYAPKMEALTGPFILGLDDTPLYRHDHAALRAAVRAEDLPAVDDAVLASARERIADAGAELDIVSDLCDPVVDEVIASYFGTPGPDRATQLRWARTLFEEIFLNVANLETIRERAHADAALWRPHLDAQIAARQAARDAGEDVPDDVLTRLLRGQRENGGLHDIAIRHNLIGLISGWIPTVGKALACIVEELLERPAELAGVQAAARAGDRDLVAAYAFEALRFRPQTVALLRTCAHDRTIAAGTDRETTIQAGAIVFCATQAAMFDEDAVDDPAAFRLDRSPDTYLHFGHGLHTCFGEQLNRRQLPAMLTALLEGPTVHRAGRLRWDGPYPAELRVALVG
ncbi:MAG: cytochrome P450 [Solirubrobacteraceae bacterium]|nr:cytochrome P450 [Solirubrobacteraceae bacterium]